MKWRHFTGSTALTDAQTYCAEQTALMQLPPDQVTMAWADPMPLTDGTYVVPAYQDDTAVDWNSGWVRAPISP